ncbi:hypothetical protein AAVH_34084 [Aphelenchoides avenae]|nr:hypothetical protein AAVH_34084 [Aphelenchus avenae]
MSSIPNEVLREVLQPLDRWTLDGVQFTNRRFLRLITERMSDVCLRQVITASFRVPNENAKVTACIQADGRPEQKIAHTDTVRLFSEFMRALRSAHVKFLTLSGLVFTPELLSLVLQTPIVTDTLNLFEGSCVELTPTQFQEVLLHFSPTSLDINTCQLRACQLTDELLRALSKKSKKRVRRIKFQNLVPVDGGSFAVTDHVIVDFCTQPDVQGQEEDAVSTRKLCGELVVSNGSFTKNLFKRLVEASDASMRTKPLRISVSPVRLEEEDIRDFEERLSYRHRGRPEQLRIYDFPAEQLEGIAAMHLQIALHPGNRLELIRAPLPNFYFYKPDE